MSVRVADWEHEDAHRTVSFNDTEEVPDLVEFLELKSRVQCLENNLNTMTHSLRSLSETVVRLRHQIEDMETPR